MHPGAKAAVFMTGLQTLAARGALGSFAAVSGLVAVAVKRFRSGPAQVPSQIFDRWLMAAFLVSRIGLYGSVFFVAHIPPRGDVLGFYLPEALRALQGGLPYRDILTSYAPLHPYLDGAVLLLWRSPLALILFALLCEAALLPLWLRLGRLCFGEEQTRMAALLYVASPISLQFVTIDGQDNVIIAVLLAAATLCLFKRRDLLSGVLVALGVACVKFLPLLYLPLFLAASRRRWVWALGFAGVMCLAYGPFAALHLQLLYPLQFEGQARTASNLPYLVEGVFGVQAPGRVEDAFLLVGLCAVLLVTLRAFRGKDARGCMRVLTLGSAALMLTLLLLSKKSWPPYLMLVLFPLCLSFAGGKYGRVRLLLFACFGVIATIAHSFWATVFGQFLAPAFHLALQHGQAGALPFLGLQVALIGGYVWLLLGAVGQLRCTDEAARDEAP